MNYIPTSFETITGLPDFIGYIFIFAFGAIVGSFLNVVIHRVPNEESIVFPNSACPKCGKNIKAYDNIPVLSWLILGGKCRNCKEKIAARYPLVELMTAFLFLLVYWQIGFNWYLPVCLIFVSAMVALIFIDAEHMILPNVITYPLFIFALLVRILFPIFFTAEYFTDLQHSPITVIQLFFVDIQTESLRWIADYSLLVGSVSGALFGALIGGGSLWLVGALWKRLRGVDAMGLGDVKMMAAVGALLGWRMTLISIFLGAFSGAIIGIFMISRQKDKDFQAQIPFGIFLGIGSIIALLFGDQLVNWYMNTFIPS